MDAIETILKNEFPELRVDVPSIHGISDIKQDELEKSIRYIRDERLIQDAEKLLTESKPLRSSVTYQIIFPQQKRPLNFKVDWIQGPMVCIGYIQTFDHLGNNLDQVRMYGMHLN